MKKLFGSIFIFCLALALILGTFQFCFAETVTTGSFEFGVTKNSNTNLENIDMDLDLGIRGDSLGLNVGIELLSEKNDIELTQMINDWSIQGLYLLKIKGVYCFADIDFKKNMDWDIDERIALGIGAGWENIEEKVKAQAGFYCAASYQDKSYDRQSIAKVLIEKEHEFHKPFSVSLKAAGELNLAEIHALDSVFNDYLTETELAIIGRVNKNLSLVASYEWDYCHLAEVTDQKIIGVSVRGEF